MKYIVIDCISGDKTTFDYLVEASRYKKKMSLIYPSVIYKIEVL